MNFIKFGNHIIAPAGAEALPLPAPTPMPMPMPMPTPRPLAPSTAFDTNEILAIAMLLQTKIKELENTIAERKARHQEWCKGVSRLDKVLVTLRKQESKEDDKLVKLTKQWNKTSLNANRYGLFSKNPGLFGLPHQQPDRFVCPTTMATSSYNNINERYMDSYAFEGPPAPWQQSTPALFSGSPSWIEQGDERANFRFVMTRSPEEEALDETFVSGQQDDSPTKIIRAALGDIRNTLAQQQQQEAGEGSRKRKSEDFEEAYEGPYKRMREVAEKPRRRGSKTRKSTWRSNGY
ncbi:hypothetical protein FB45DRAFT_1033419 [Roridomyces roridus]|uniref:Uncharacterized protein n=1 Tax=Roridomyces roridus TaxID=1738132 RepID=A0AAD7FEQ7_9AGAR|nr:hypothetical protein FB45DRAFT_1033419 [Roridomyces roridus]